MLADAPIALIPPRSRSGAGRKPEHTCPGDQLRGGMYYRGEPPEGRGRHRVNHVCSRLRSGAATHELRLEFGRASRGQLESRPVFRGFTATAVEYQLSASPPTWCPSADDSPGPRLAPSTPGIADRHEWENEPLCASRAKIRSVRDRTMYLRLMIAGGVRLEFIGCPTTPHVRRHGRIAHACAEAMRPNSAAARRAVTRGAHRHDCGVPVPDVLELLIDSGSIAP
jgi:hypothetical protein